ncbi:LysR family transcriptional regulator [Nocardia puris]|uniref:LysR substrate-binding domain-containing protein n=1 Tax=Nocardia puris TaxID=208602 RepID=UPI001E3572FD|nr:LysR family transcriptional regulator [Nocardia puris]
MSRTHGSTAEVRMSGVELREVEAFLALAEELHFGRAAERLYVSQSRVSQLLRALERRVGARLFDRSSRRVRLTPLGADFLERVRPAYAALHASVDAARAAARDVSGRLRVGFQGAINAHIMAAVGVFEERHPDCAVDLVEIPLADPFGPVRRGDADVAAVLLPMAEDDLVLGPSFSEQPMMVAVAAGHPFAGRAAVSAEELAECSLIGMRGPAPDYWRRAQALDVTPGGCAIPVGPEVGTLEEGLAVVATGRGALLLCRPTASYHERPPVVFVPVTGLPDSRLGVVWRRGAEDARVRAFARAVVAARESLDAASEVDVEAAVRVG